MLEERSPYGFASQDRALKYFARETPIGGEIDEHRTAGVAELTNALLVVRFPRQRINVVPPRHGANGNGHGNELNKEQVGQPPKGSFNVDGSIGDLGPTSLLNGNGRRGVE